MYLLSCRGGGRPTPRSHHASISPTLSVVVLVAGVLGAPFAWSGGPVRPLAGTPAVDRVLDDGSIGCPSPWRAPVDAPIRDPFRPPDDPYGPGNRGIEFATEPGQPVVAVDRGLIAFAGPVAGSPVVVVDHGGGLRSSYVRLLESSVAAGVTVTAGERLGLADSGFHLGARTGDRYIDPLELIERRCLVVRLVAW